MKKIIIAAGRKCGVDKETFRIKICPSDGRYRVGPVDTRVAGKIIVAARIERKVRVVLRVQFEVYFSGKIMKTELVDVIIGQLK